MRRPPFFVALVLAACGGGDDAANPTNDSAAETGTGVDTDAPTETVPETTTPSETSADTRPEEVASETCGCGSDTVCLQAKDPSACAAVLATCGGGGLQRVDACATDDVMATCEKMNTIQYLYWARIDGWIADAAEACGGIVSPGTFSVATVPEPHGAPCSCQRSAAACVQTYGALCDALPCEAGLQSSGCAEPSRLPGRCVTRDGQREIVFYSPAADAAVAESSCLGASATPYYWFPDGFY